MELLNKYASSSSDEESDNSSEHAGQKQVDSSTAV